jgi:mono/diheme cytochrome c family protein
MNSFASSLIIVALFLCAGCRPPGRPTEADIELKPDQVRDFAVLYAQNCAGCHGKDGKGNSAFALANPIYLAIASEDTLRRGTAQGVQASLMPAFAKSAGGTLTDEQIDIIVREIRTRWANPADVAGANPPPYVAKEPGNAGNGKAAYVTFCAGCHGPEGRGTAKGSSIVDESFLRLVTDQNLRTTVIAGRPEIGHPDWRHCLPNKEMSPQDVTDVVAWLATRRNPNSNAPYASNESSKKNN